MACKKTRLSSLSPRVVSSLLYRRSRRLCVFLFTHGALFIQEKPRGSVLVWGCGALRFGRTREKVDKRRGNYSADTSHEFYLIIHTHTHINTHSEREWERENEEYNSKLLYIHSTTPHIQLLWKPHPVPLGHFSLSLHFTPPSSWHTFVVTRLTTINAKCHIVHIVNINLCLSSCCVQHGIFSLSSIFFFLFIFFICPSVYVCVCVCIFLLIYLFFPISFFFIESHKDTRLFLLLQLLLLLLLFLLCTCVCLLIVFPPRRLFLVALLSFARQLSLNMYMYVILKRHWPKRVELLLYSSSSLCLCFILKGFFHSFFFFLYTRASSQSI